MYQQKGLGVCAKQPADNEVCFDSVSFTKKMKLLKLTKQGRTREIQDNKSLESPMHTK